MSEDNLTEKQSAFVREYLIDLNATQAAIRSGYSKDTAYSTGWENLRKPEIVKEIKEAQKDLADRTFVSQEWIINNLKTIAERSMQTAPVVNKKGEQLLVENAEGEIVPAYTFNAAGATGALQLIGKHLGMFSDKINIGGQEDSPLRSHTTVEFIRSGKD